MLTVRSAHDAKNCAGVSRRDFIRFGALGLGGLTLPGLLNLKAQAGAEPNFVRDKSVVLLFLSGGASHIETFDPKMTAPDTIRSVTGEIKTTLPGVTFGSTFPLLAQQAHRMAVVRSFHHPDGNHESAIRHVLSGGTRGGGSGPKVGDTAGFSMGSVYSRLRGTNHPKTGLPTYSLLTSPDVDGQYSTERGRVESGSTPGTLGMSYGPFDPSGGGPTVKNMQLKISEDRLGDRRGLLKELDRLNRQVDASGSLGGFDQFEQQAFDLILGGANQAFDLKHEDKRLVERYDTSQMKVGHKKFSPSLLGKNLLLARRMCEAGCGFVTVHSAGWDMHADGNNPGMETGMEMLGRPLDKAVSAFLEDLEQRGLSEKILLVITGDFGRTPTINKRGGRDHWANLGTLAFVGGGLNMGQVIGQSDRKAGVPAADPVTPENLMCTLLHALFDIPQLRLKAGVPREIMQIVERGEPIKQLF